MNQTIDQLRIAYETWIASQNLTLESAEEALSRDALTPLQRTWLMRFIQLWDATYAMSPHIVTCGTCGKDAGDDWETVEDEHQEIICAACRTADMPSPHMEYANDCPVCGGDVNQGKCTCQEIG